MKEYSNKNVKQLADALGFRSLSSFADALGVQKNVVTNWRGRGMGRSAVSTVISRFPQVNVEWLVTGDGEPLKELATAIEERKRPLFDTSKLAHTLVCEERPHYITLAKAGLPTEEGDRSYEMQPVIQQLPRYDYTVSVRGDSMSPEYKSGDVIACLDVTKSSFIQWGRVHILNTAQGVMLKKIYDNDDSVRCVSINTEEYPEYCIPKEEIYTIGLVVGSIRIS